MNDLTERSQNLKTIPISNLSIGDSLINLGIVLEILERHDCYSLVIDRMEERQVWKFNKTEDLMVIKESE